MSAYNELMDAMQPRRVLGVAPPHLIENPLKPRLEDFVVERWEEPCAVYVQPYFLSKLLEELSMWSLDNNITIHGVPVYPVYYREDHPKIKVYYAGE